MAYDETLAQRVRQRLGRRKNVEEKKMLAGVGFLLNGNLLVGVRKDSLLVRIDPEHSDQALKEPHVSELQIKGRREFYWRQFTAAADLGMDMVYVAMFDEVDEGTAIFKVTDRPPSQAHFETYDGLPSDWYLPLTSEGSKVIRGERPNQMTLPIKP